jgi:catechol 2,3-dioxygenase-like lactoylglutathione lyase family enzyme
VTAFHQAVPILNVRDVEASIAYYTEQLAFTDSWRWGSPPGFGGVSRDQVQVFFCKDCQGGPGTWLSIWVDDVDALHDEIAARGADVRQPPTSFEWGVRELNVADPDGHRIRFSMPTRGPSDGVPFPD